jgi:hypothetical protein
MTLKSNLGTNSAVEPDIQRSEEVEPLLAPLAARKRSGPGGAVDKVFAWSVERAAGLTVEGVPTRYTVTVKMGMLVIHWLDPDLDVTDEAETAAILADQETMNLLKEAREEKAAGRLKSDREVRGNG